MSTDPHERFAREQKAQKLAAYVAGQALRILESADDELWEATAAHAGVNAPSEDTKKRVREILLQKWMA